MYIKTVFLLVVLAYFTLGEVTTKSDEANTKSDVATKKSDVASTKSDIASTKSNVATTKSDEATTKLDESTTSTATSQTVPEVEVTTIKIRKSHMQKKNRKLHKHHKVTTDYLITEYRKLKKHQKGTNNNIQKKQSKLKKHPKVTYNNGTTTQKSNNVTKPVTRTLNWVFKENNIVPDVFYIGPEKTLDVIYASDKQVKLGNELAPKDVINAPTVKYNAESNSFYTLILTDPDAPSRKNPKAREWHHWLVVNIPGSEVSKGEALSQYIGAAPPKDTGLHRYVFLLFKQPEKLKFHETIHHANDGNRAKFNTMEFAKKYNLGSPVAGNFFQAQWDDSVPATHRRLGF